MAVIDVRKWGGSLVSTIEQEETIPGDFISLRNFIYDFAGFPVVRGGRRKWGAELPSTVSGLYYYRSGWIANGSEDWLIACSGGSIYQSNQDGVWTEILNGLDVNCVPSFTSLRGWLVFASDSSAVPRPHYWNAAQERMEPLDQAPFARIVSNYAGRLWLVDFEYPSRLWYSELYEPNGWKQGTLEEGLSGYIIVGPGDGNDISALVPGYAGEMIIFKDGPTGGATYRLSGSSPSDFAVTPLSTTIGAINHRSVALVGDKDVYFCSRRGIHSLRRVFTHGDLESQFLDFEIANRWRSLTEHQKRNAFCVDDFTHDTWWLFVDTDSDGINDTGWLFNYRRTTARGNPSVSDVSFGAQSASMWRDRVLGRDLLVTGGQTQVYTEHNPETVDEGVSLTPIDWSATLAPIDAGNIFTMKAWGTLYLSYDAWGTATAAVSWHGDEHPTTSENLDLNPSGVPTPATGASYDRDTYQPQSTPVLSLTHLHEAGRRLTVSIYGSQGRIRLRGMKIMLEEGDIDPSAPQWFRKRPPAPIVPPEQEEVFGGERPGKRGAEN